MQNYSPMILFCAALNHSLVGCWWLLPWFVQYSGKLFNTQAQWCGGGGGHCKTKEIKILKCNPNKNRTRANVINISNCTVFEMQSPNFTSMFKQKLKL